MYPLVFKKLTITITAASIAQKISETAINTNQVEFHVTSGSTGPVFIGDLTVANTWIPRSGGSTTTFTSSSGGSFVKDCYFDLSQIYVLSATKGDTIIIQYLDRGVL